MNTLTKARRLALLTGIAGMAIAAPAVAQQAPQGDAAPASDATAPETTDTTDIVVTATRRSERLQDVPIAVSTISADQIAKGGFQKLTDLQYQFSGLQYGTSPNDSGFRMRGVGSAGGFSSSSEQNVGTVVDNVVIPFGNPVQSLGDLERVEVLKGPQGTQFGKNASSGVINITTAKPKFDAISGKGFVSYAELNEVNANGAINVPLAANAAVAVYGFYRRNDGFLHDVPLNIDWGAEKSYGGRAKLLWEPSSDLSIYVIGDYSKTTRVGPGQLWSLKQLPFDFPANPQTAARFGNLTALGITPGFYNDKSAEEYPGFGSEENFGASLEINKQLGTYNLTSITAYRKFAEGKNNFAIDGSSIPIFTAQQDGVPQTFVSQELRLTSPKGSAFEFTTGVYGSIRKSGDNNHFSRAQLRPAAPFPAGPGGSQLIVDIAGGQSNTQTRSASAAAFIDGRFHVNEQLSLIGGARYQYDKVDARFYSIIDPAFAPGSFTAAGFVAPYTPTALKTGQVNKGGFSGRAGLEYKVNRDLLLFATVARGYLGPTVAFSGLTGTQSSVNPQTVRDVTVGIKSLFNRAVTFNANVFFDQYKNLQTSVFNGIEFLTQNAGGFRANGFEADASWRVSKEFSLHGSFTYSDTKFTDYITACPTDLKPGFTCFNQNGASVVQARGEPLSGAPKTSATFGADIKLPINDSLTFDWSANAYYRSRVQYAVAQVGAFQKGYATIGLNAGVGSSDGRWRLGVFARNLLVQRFQAAVINLPFANAGAYVNWMTREGRRTVGGSVQFSF